MKRFTLVEKAAGDVGTGTAFPLLVTLDQLAEILYRVKDAWFTAGSFTYTLGDDSISLIGPSESPPAAPLNNSWSDSDGGVAYLVDTGRGYYAQQPEESEFEMPEDYEGYFGEEYAYTASVLDEGTFRVWDIADNERAIWLPDLDDEEISGAFPGFVAPNFVGRIACGLSYFATCGGGFDGGDPSEYSPPAIDTPGWWFGGNMLGEAGGGAGATFYLTGQIAWVDTNESGNPYDPENELYLGCDFRLSRTDGGDFCEVVSNRDLIPFGFIEVGEINLYISLASSTPAIRLYVAQAVMDGEGAFSAEDFELTAQEWWPYAQPGGPVWNEETGAKL